MRLLLPVAAVSLTVALSAQGTPPPQPPPVSQAGQDVRVTTSLLGRPGTPPHMAVPAFVVLTPDAETQAAAQTITEVLRADLAFEREFDMMDPRSYASIPSAQTIEGVPFDRWNELNAEYVVQGTVQKGADGRITVSVRVIGIKDRRQAFGESSSPVALSSARRISHFFSDRIHKAIRNVDGVAMTLVAFSSTRDGERMGQTVEDRSSKEIYIMDYDGANQRRVTANRSLNLSPSWGPDGQTIAYQSYSTRYPDIVVQNIYGQAVASRPAHGTDLNHNYMPAVSPDGTKIAFGSTREGRAMDIYVVNRDGTGLRQLTSNPAIDEAPAWSPNGSLLAFISARTGSQRIYTMEATGGSERMLPTACTTCDRPTFAPGSTGVLLAYTTMTSAGGGHDIELYDFSTQQSRRVTNGLGTNESPTFAPNGRHIIFFTTRWGKPQLACVDIDGQNVRQLTTVGANNFPNWSGFITK